MNDLKAIGVLLIPEQKIINLAVDLNKKIGAKKRFLDKELHLPHITLMFGGMLESDFLEVQSVIDEALQKFFPLNLEIIRINKGRFTDLAVDTTKEIQNLHEFFMGKLTNILSNQVGVENIFEFPEVAPGVPDWINNFITKSANQNYYPHITIGDGQGNKIKLDLPIEFKIDRIVLSHMANMCNAGPILYEVKV